MPGNRKALSTTVVPHTPLPPLHHASLPFLSLPTPLACARDCSAAQTNMRPLLGVCMQSLHPADPGGGASLPSNGCGAPGPEGE